MKILREKIFGAIKRANKAKKKAWEIQTGKDIVPQFPGIPDHIAKRMTRSATPIEAIGAHNVNLVDIDTGEKITRIYSPKYQAHLKKTKKPPLHVKINSKAYFTGRGENIPEKIKSGEDLLYLTREISKDERPSANKSNSKDTQRMLEVTRKGTRKHSRGIDIVEDFQQEQKTKKENLSKASIEKHKEKADKLRNNNKLSIAARDAKRWMKKNPGKTAAIGATVAAAGAGLGYAAYKHHKNKKKEEK